MKVIDQNIKQVIQNTNGKFFRVSWIKKNGDVRVASAQTRVTKGLTGVGRNWEDKENQITVFERSTQKRIVITTDQVIDFSCGSVILTA